MKHQGQKLHCWQDALEPNKIMELVWHECCAYHHGDSDSKRRCMEMSFGIMHWCAYTALPALAQGKSRIGDFWNNQGFDQKTFVERSSHKNPSGNLWLMHEVLSKSADVSDISYLSTQASGCSSGGRLGALLVSRNISSVMFILLKDQKNVWYVKQRQTIYSQNGYVVLAKNWL